MKRLVLALLLTSGVAAAHSRSASYAVWRLRPDGGTVTVKVALYDLARLRGDRPSDEYLLRRVTLHVGDAPCLPVAGSLRPGAAEPGMLVREWDVRCGDGPRAVGSSLFADELPTHLHFVRVVDVGERVLTAATPRWELAGDERGLGGFVRLGIAHILGGADHLVFLLVLVAAARRLRTAALVATGFTLGHSASLALAALGAARVEAGAVEALVGLSIVVVGVENVAERDPWPGRVLAAAVAAIAVADRWPLALGGAALFCACYFPLAAGVHHFRVAVALLFGLVHGFAFAGVLGELSLPRERLLPALFGFNVGVELGQLAVLAVVWPLVAALHRTRVRRPALAALSATAVAVGVYWLVRRAL